jgi:hypothetical protein
VECDQESQENVQRKRWTCDGRDDDTEKLEAILFNAQFQAAQVFDGISNVDIGEVQALAA